MASNFPTGIDDLTNPSLDPDNPSYEDTLSHAAQHANANDAIETTQAKIGIDGDTDADTHDYKLSSVPSGEKAVSLNGEETLTQKTLTSPVINTPVVNTPEINTPEINDPTIIDGFVGAKAHLAALLDTTVSGAITKVMLDEEDYDVGGNFASSQFVAPVNGFYSISGSVSYKATTANKAYWMYIQGDGQTLLGAYNVTSADANTYITACNSDTVYLAAGAIVTLHYYHTGATSVDIEPASYQTFLSVVLLRQVT